MTRPKPQKHDAHVQAYTAWVEAWLSVRTTAEGDCRLWNGCMDTHGGPVASVLGERIRVRRWLFERKVRRLAPGEHVVVACENDRCVHHLQAMTKTEFNGWLGRTGRLSTPDARAAHRRGAQALRVYSDEQVQQVRDLFTQGLTQAEISRRTGVGQSRVSDYVTNKDRAGHAPAASAFTWRPAP
jgi:hypothetical protein